MSNLPSEPEFEQAYKELVSTLENSSLFEKHPNYKTALKVTAIPERVIQFRVVWEDDKGQLQVNRGYRVQFNSALVSTLCSSSQHYVLDRMLLLW